MRILYYIRIMMHSPEELGSLAKPFLERQRRTYGPNAEEIYREKIKKYWEEITECLKEKKLDTLEKCRKMHIYVDGLTAQPFYCKTCFDKTGEKYYMDEIASNKIRCSLCGRVVEAAVEEFLSKLVNALIEEKILLYLIIEKLMERGAKIHGTESQALLIEEHNMWVNAKKGISPDSRRKAELLIERDEFIAKRINETLPENEIGILFIGAAHKVDDELKKISDIKIIYL